MIIPDSAAKAFGDIKISDIDVEGLFANDAALKLVVQDATRTDAWLTEKQWSLSWRETDILYQSPRTGQSWEGTTVTKANVSRFTVSKHVNSIVPQLMEGVFYDDPPFMLKARPGTDQNTVRAKTTIGSTLLDMMDFEMQVERGLFSDALFGTAIWKWGWHSEKKKEKRYVRKNQPVSVQTQIGNPIDIPTEEEDEFEIQEVEVDEQRPFFEQRDHRYVLVDPGCRIPDIRYAKFVIDRMYLTFDDLNALRDVEGYDIPAEDELKAFFFPPKEMAVLPGSTEMSQGLSAVQRAAPRYEKTTIDPTEQPLEVLERWDNGKVITVLNRKLVIRNEKNPFGKIPFYSCNWWNVPDSFWGLGIGRIIGQDQRVDQGVTNAALDILSLAVNPQYARSRGANVPTQQIRSRLGGIVDVDGEVDKAFRLIEQPKIPGEVWAAIANANAEAESASGANELLVQGAMPAAGRSSMTRTATGASSFAAATASRLQGPLGRFIDQVFVPWMYQMDELVNERMPSSLIRKIIGDEIGKDFKLDMDKFLNARIDYEVLAGTKLAAKRSMQQALPLIIQLLESPQMLEQNQAMGYMVDSVELCKAVMEMAGWPNTRTFIRPMTPQEQQQAQQANPQVQQAQAKQSQADQAFQHKQALIDQENEARAARDVLKETMKHAMEWPGGGKGAA